MFLHQIWVDVQFFAGSNTFGVTFGFALLLFYGYRTVLGLAMYLKNEPNCQKATLGIFRPTFAVHENPYF